MKLTNEQMEKLWGTNSAETELNTIITESIRNNTYTDIESKWCTYYPENIRRFISEEKACNSFCRTFCIHIEQDCECEDLIKFKKHLNEDR